MKKLLVVLPDDMPLDGMLTAYGREFVTCKDCSFSEYVNNPFGGETLYCHKWNIDVSEKFFCGEPN